MVNNKNIPKNDNGDVICFEVEQKLIYEMDKYIAEGLFDNRDQFISAALANVILG